MHFPGVNRVVLLTRLAINKSTQSHRHTCVKNRVRQTRLKRFSVSREIRTIFLLLHVLPASSVTTRRPKVAASWSALVRRGPATTRKSRVYSVVTILALLDTPFFAVLVLLYFRTPTDHSALNGGRDIRVFSPGKTSALNQLRDGDF